MWLTNMVAVRGQSHITGGIPCQDKVYTSRKNGVTVIALADGAGSRSNSQYGAQISCVAAAEYFTLHANEMYNSDRIGVFREDMLRCILDALGKEAERLGLESIRELASTLLCAAVYKDKLFTMHIGDGVIAYRKNGSLLVLSEPDNGEYANITTFVTSRDALEHMRLKVADIPDDVDALFLMSDGSADSLYNVREKRPANVLNMFADSSKEYSNISVREELSRVFTEVISQRTDDDCSLTYMVRGDSVPDKTMLGVNPKDTHYVRRCRYMMDIIRTVNKEGRVSVKKLCRLLHRRSRAVERDVDILVSNCYLYKENGWISLA